MARIMCAPALRRWLGQAGRPADVVEPPLPGAALGSWAANVFRRARRNLVIALNERTCLTVVFPLAPKGHFRFQFASALAHVLEDLRLPPEVVRLESASIAVEPLVRLADRSLKGTLDDLAFFCDIELGYHDDLRIVQLNLNEIPHPNRNPCVPIQAVNRLFGARVWNAGIQAPILDARSRVGDRASLSRYTFGSQSPLVVCRSLRSVPHEYSRPAGTHPRR